MHALARKGGRACRDCAGRRRSYPACEPRTYSVTRAAAGIPDFRGGGCQGLRLDHCGPPLDQAVSQAVRRRLLRSARASRRTASSVSAIAASVITAAITSPVRAERPAPFHRAPASPPWPTLGRSVVVGIPWRAAGLTRWIGAAGTRTAVIPAW